MIAPPFFAENGSVHRFRGSPPPPPRVLLRCAPLWGLSVVHAPWLSWILLLLLGEDRGVAVLPEGWCYDLPERCICLLSCTNSSIKHWLVRRSASTSSVLACTVSNAPTGGRLSTLPGWSCILDGLAWLLLVFRVDTISY